MRADGRATAWFDEEGFEDLANEPCTGIDTALEGWGGPEQQYLRKKAESSGYCCSDEEPSDGTQKRQDIYSLMLAAAHFFSFLKH